MPCWLRLSLLLLPSGLLLANLAFGERPEPKGEDLFPALGCRGCHVAAGIGGSRGPVLDGVGTRLAVEQLRRALTERAADSTMPAFTYLTRQELEALLAYLRTL